MSQTTRRGFFSALSGVAVGAVAASAVPEVSKPVGQTITIQLDGRVIAKAVKDEIEKHWKRVLLQGL